MRFSRLILIVLGLALALLLVVNFSLSVMHSRHYLSRQLAVHSQDTATALGLSLASAMQHSDQWIVAMLFTVSQYAAFSVASVLAPLVALFRQSLPSGWMRLEAMLTFIAAINALVCSVALSIAESSAMRLSPKDQSLKNIGSPARRV